MLGWRSKLNPWAEEFVPSSRRLLSAASPEFFPSGLSSASSQSSHVGSESACRRDANSEKEAKIRRTVYVGDIDPRVTEEELLRALCCCGTVKDCRICGNTRSGLRYGFVEFETEDCARAAMRLNCTRIGRYPVRVLPSRTSIIPLNPLPPAAEDLQGKVARTVYCSFIDKMLNEEDLKEFFGAHCGEVSGIRLLTDHRSTTGYAFIEFVKEEFAVAAIKCTGMLLGNFRIKVVTSKAPIRPREH